MSDAWRKVQEFERLGDEKEQRLAEWLACRQERRVRAMVSERVSE